MKLDVTDTEAVRSAIYAYDVSHPIDALYPCAAINDTPKKPLPDCIRVKFTWEVWFVGFPKDLLREHPWCVQHSSASLGDDERTIVDEFWSRIVEEGKYVCFHRFSALEALALLPIIRFRRTACEPLRNRFDSLWKIKESLFRMCVLEEWRLEWLKHCPHGWPGSFSLQRMQQSWLLTVVRMEISWLFSPFLATRFATDFYRVLHTWESH